MKEILKNLTSINLTKSTRNKNDINFIVIHYTGNVDDTAYSNTKFFNTIYRGASAHYFVDFKEIYQCVEDKNIAWHCGTKGQYFHKYCRNNNSIGIEVCATKTNKNSVKATDKDWYFLPETENNLIELVKFLMKKYDIKKDCILRHYDITHKLCPAPYMKTENWKKFLEKLGEEEKVKYYEDITEIPTFYRDTINWYIEKGYIKGTEKGLHLTEEMVRILTILYRVKEGEGYV